MHLQNSESKANRHRPAAPKLWGGFLTGLMAATLFVTARGVAPAASFGLPVALATNNLGGYKVSSALDTNSDAIALWSGHTTTAQGRLVNGVRRRVLAGRAHRPRPCI